MNETGDGAATAVDLIEPLLDRLEDLFDRIQAKAAELKEDAGGDPES